MDEVRVRKTELIEILRKNRSEHRTQFEQAIEGYRQTALEVLEENLGRLRSGKRDRIVINLPAPDDHTKDYDRMLRMLELSLDDEVKLDQAAFAQYVMDDWQWKAAWVMSNTAYISKARN